MTSFREGVVRIVAGGLFLALFFGIWQPARSALAVHVVAPTLTALTGTPVEPVDKPPSVRTRSLPEARTFSIPAGLHFLLPGLLLVIVAPRRPYWLVLWGLLLALGLVMLGAFGLGLAGVPGGFVAHGFLHVYVVPAASLGAALFLLYGAHLRRALDARTKRQEKVVHGSRACPDPSPGDLVFPKGGT
ncbi:MAG TPA: hypothetical protein VD962_01080 [Rubricoccaceae bacterium]|nr:hypothetical protein [Rubricoccaceae bacterium]